MIDGEIRDGTVVESVSQYGGGGLFNNGGTVILINSLIIGNKVAADVDNGSSGGVSFEVLCVLFGDQALLRDSRQSIFCFTGCPYSRGWIYHNYWLHL